MATLAAGSIDIDKPGDYPIALSDALLGKASHEVYTGIRYNHKPDRSSDSSSTSLHLQPSSSDPNSYDLSYSVSADTYSYKGSRTSDEGQYVLIFDPVKKHFVLHRVDSTFDMNLVSAPWAQDAGTLRSQYTQLKTESPPQLQPQPAQRKPTKSAKGASSAKAPAKRSKVEKPKLEKQKKKPVRKPSPEPEDEDSDDGLTIEYPDAPSSQQNHYQSTPAFRRNASEASEDDSHGEGGYEEEQNQDVDLLKLPSPANNTVVNMHDDMELDLEAELEQALNEDRAESSESEEE